MSKDPKTSKAGAVHVIGAEGTGVTKKVASHLSRRIKEAYGQSGKHVRLKGMRFIPSTKIDLGEGSFQVIANTVIEIASSSGAKRAESIDSVVTIDGKKNTGQVLRDVKIPSLG